MDESCGKQQTQQQREQPDVMPCYSQSKLNDDEQPEEEKTNDVLPGRDSGTELGALGAGVAPRGIAGLQAGDAKEQAVRQLHLIAENGHENHCEKCR